MTSPTTFTALPDPAPATQRFRAEQRRLVVRWVAPLLAFALGGCLSERSLVRCRATSTHFDGDGGAIAWVPSVGAGLYSLHKPAFLACDSPAESVCTVLPTFACTVERQP